MKKMSKMEMAIRAACKELNAGNKINAIKEVKERYPERELTDANDFVSWLEGYFDLHPKDLAESWCERCWDIFPCEHGGAPEVMTAGATPAAHRNEGTSGRHSPPVPQDSPNLKPECKCGDPACADPWHYGARWVGQPGNAQVADEDSQEQQGETKHADSKRRVTQMTIAEQFIASANRDEFLLVTPHQFENDDFILFGDGSAACPWENEATPDLAALEAGLDAALEFALRNLEGENDGGIVDLMQFLKDKGLR